MKPQKRKRKPRTNWKALYEASRREAVESNAWMAERKTMLFSCGNELSKYRLICDWACGRIENLEAEVSRQRTAKELWIGWWERRNKECAKLEDDILMQQQELARMKAIKHFCHGCGEVHEAGNCKGVSVNAASHSTGEQA